MDEYCGRPDHQDFCDFINSSTDVEKAKRTCNDTLRNINLEVYETIRNSRYFWIERTADSTVENTLSQVERHFRW